MRTSDSAGMGILGRRANAAPPTARRAVAWGSRTVALALVVACASGTAGIYALLDFAEAHFHTADVAAELHDGLAQLADVSRDLEVARPVSPGLANRAAAIEQRARGLLTELRDSGYEPQRVRPLIAAANTYLATFSRERAASIAGNRTRAAALADLEDSQFATLTPRAQSIVQELRREAYRAAAEVRNVIVGLTLFLVTTVVAVLLWWGRRERRRAESAALNKGQARFEALVEHSSDLIAVLDNGGRIAYVSPSITNVMGARSDGYVGAGWDTLSASAGKSVSSEDAAMFSRVLAGSGESGAFEYSLPDRNGTQRRYEAVATNLLDEPNVRGIVLNSRDITDRAQLENQLRDREQSFRMLFEDNPYPMWVFDNDTLRFLQVNDAACQQYGYTHAELAGMTILDLREPEARAELADLVKQRDLSASRPAAVWRHRTHDGTLLDVEVRAHQTTFEGHHATLVLAQDVTERRRLESALEHRAFHDPLTELPNRALFRDRVQHAIEAAPRAGGKVSVLMLDLDGFKTVNDTLGHAAGDELLDLAARRLETRLRSGDTIARMGGDEFAVLLEKAAPGESSTLADRLLETLRQPFIVHGQEVFLTGSIGIAEAPADAALPATRSQLLRDADLAMYVAKDAGRDRYAVFEEQMRARNAHRLNLATDLQHAMEREQLCLYYQPTVRLDTLEIVGLEALLRWTHPTHGVIMPADFVPLAEETGLIVPIGRWILNEACRQVAHWRHTISGCERLGIAINVSGRQLQGPPFVSDVRDALDLAGIDPGAVTLEITESILLADTESISQQLHALKQLGVHLAIDDFGTGYSSLSYLTQFPLDVMKLDKSFLAGIGDSSDRRALLRSIIDMGHSLHLSTLGEGIETEAELNRLRACGCDLGQGFLFARPLTPADATRRLGQVVSPIPVNSP